MNNTYRFANENIKKILEMNKDGYLNPGIHYVELPEKYKEFADFVSSSYIDLMCDDGFEMWRCPKDNIAPDMPCSGWNCSVCRIKALLNFYKKNGIKYEL